MVNVWYIDLIYAFFQDTKVFWGTVFQGHGNDGFFMDLPLQKVQ